MIDARFKASPRHGGIEVGTVSDCDKATGAHRLVGARPVEHGCGSVLRQRKEKYNRSIGVKGACPLMLPPPPGERGVTLAISTPT